MKTLFEKENIILVANFFSYCHNVSSMVVLITFLLHVAKLFSLRIFIHLLWKLALPLYQTVMFLLNLM